MRIAIASDDNINITGHVGKCKSFLIYDIVDGKVWHREIRKNTFTDHGRVGHKEGMHAHGSGHGNTDGHKKLIFGLRDCEYLISHGMGRKLVEDLKSLDLEPFVTTEINAETAAIKLEQGKLKYNDELICN